MKKKLALVLAAVLMFAAFAGCSGSGSGSSASPSPSASAPAESQPAQAGELNVAVFYYNYSDVYISSVRNNMDEMLTALGVNYDNFDGAGNQSQQTDQINTALANGANLLIVNIVETSSPDAAQNAVNAAKDAGIPIIFFNREVSDDVVNSYDKCAFVGTDAPEAGHMQGKLIGEYLLANYEAVDLNGDGVISYVMFKGQEGNAEAEARTQFGVEDADTVLTGAGKPALAYYAGDVATKYQVDQNGSWSAAAAVAYMDTILAEYSEANGNMVELVIANNDDMALGAISSLQTAGYNLGDGSSKTIPVFGVDAIDSAKQAIDEGKMTGTIMQDAAGMAETITTLVGNIKDGAALMDNTGDLNVDEGVAKIRVPYGVYTAE
ncbi:MAG: galactose ABC transporter substrate-binding protein [Clostridiales bacterium]|uniref:D-galactose/methyl-galactoside binding periplasmic protein MglB n=1 Tax=Intestinimonas massiliensis (ex Afouda et al. 2020) TaxID=1673721 RepID=A0AAW5JME5_9FIRM|nr:galactose ABC transporter substrate-binding protein [Intestinimonas massiliensis (ex Afouda et al. 2020)]MDU1325075.1 galactose ABC transporter substrate-binding protein [Clostridiales bacterium]SCJ35547.1 D-galactose/ D-glucose-binding protein [uncultured Flavonifractor sp.]BDE86163.1 galactose ABC transporter substrate-binding protein [Oscillospiraceae bacterium]MCG4527457.1 galactose ABC transporter substrate-binding protein [Intestinimonas massiliensis (ex Afouda et al. 2020)]MCQ4770010